MSANNQTFNSNRVSNWNCISLEKATKPDDNLKAASESSTSARKRSCCDVCAIGSLLLFGFMFLTFGVLTTKFPLFDIVLWERLHMSPLYPSFFWWKDPEPEVLMNFYVFNITNSAEFITKIDDKLKLHEIGPIVFQEILEHKDIEFHEENSTMSYTVHRRLVFKESANIEGILNQTVTVPNMASLSGCTYLADNWILRKSYNMIMRKFKTQPVVETTIYNYLFNLSDPILEFTANIVPFLVPTKHTGILQNIYRNFTDRVNVKFGARHGNENFFGINTYNYRSTAPRFEPENGDCNADITGSSEGALYPQFITKDTVLSYFRKTLCRAVPLYFDSEVQMEKLKAYKFILREDVYDRFKTNTTADCYKGSNLPDGLSDVSKCFFDQPIVASHPHFYSRPNKFTEKLEGLEPNPLKHKSYSIIEPIMGVPLRSAARSQSNIITKDLSSYKSDIARFSNMALPMFWVEYYLDKITPIIIDTVAFIVNTLPRIQYYVSGAFIIAGLCLLMMGYFRLRNNEEVESREKKKKKKKDDGMKNGE